jgi:uncharacterized protein (DUF302 family)
MTLASKASLLHLPVTLGLGLALAFGLLSSTSGAAETDAAQPMTAPAGSVVVEMTVEQPFDTALATLKDQLQADGWNLISELDIGGRLAKKGVEVPGGLVILQLTSGKNAVPLLAKDDTRYISALMPCSLSVYGKEDGSVTISRMNFEMLAPALEPEVAEVMQRSLTKLNRSVDAAVAKLREG